MKPNVHSEIYNKVKTLLVFFNRLPRRIDAKNIALMLVGLPYCTTFTFVLSTFFSGFGAALVFEDGGGTPETPEVDGDWVSAAPAVLLSFLTSAYCTLQSG